MNVHHTRREEACERASAREGQRASARERQRDIENRCSGRATPRSQSAPRQSAPRQYNYILEQTRPWLRTCQLLSWSVCNRRRLDRPRRGCESGCPPRSSGSRSKRNRSITKLTKAATGAADLSLNPTVVADPSLTSLRH
jgi:hypothetical protein